MKEWIGLGKEGDLYDIQYNGQTTEMLGVYLYDYPEFSGAEKQYDEWAVSGRKGCLVGKDTGKNNLKISCTFGILSPEFMQNIRRLKQWLSGTGELILSDSPEVYYRVNKIDYGSLERELRRYGRFSVTFNCMPFEYLQEGKKAYPADEVRYNPYSLCSPVYQITGEGKCTLTVNGNRMTADVAGDLMIDTDRMMAYKKDGTVRNTTVSGDYDSLMLNPGENTVSITAGFSLMVIPNWGYDI